MQGAFPKKKIKNFITKIIINWPNSEEEKMFFKIIRK